MGKIWCGLRWWRRGELLRRSETAAPASLQRISVNKPMVSSLPLLFIAAALVLLPLADRGGVEWGKGSFGEGDSGDGKGLVLPVLWRGTWERSISGLAKPLRWGWTTANLSTKALGNKRLWLQCCLLGVLDIDLARHGGEEEGEDDGDYVSTCGQTTPSYSSVRWSSARRSQHGSLHDASSVEADCKWGSVCGSGYLLVQLGARVSFDARCSPLFLLAAMATRERKRVTVSTRCGQGAQGSFRLSPSSGVFLTSPTTSAPFTHPWQE
jgi:hypothetical protein